MRRVKKKFARRWSVRRVAPTICIRNRSRDGRPEDRLATVMSVGGRHVAFYRSTGTGTPGLVKAGEWAPFNGISRRGGGWFVKAPGKVPTGDLKSAASRLSRSRLRATKVFDEADYETREAHYAAVNRYLKRYDALYSEGGGPFVQGTINIGKGV